GEGQTSSPLQRWQDFGSADLAKVESDGSLTTPAIHATSSSTRAAWQETGTAVDPSFFANGNVWFNSAESSHKSVDGGQKHSQPQVICSTEGTSASATELTSLGKCHIPATLILPGDRFTISFDLSHEGGVSSYSYAVLFAGSVLTSRSAPGEELLS